MKACPFCGGAARLHTEELDERHSYGRRAQVVCSQCGARTAAFFHDEARGYADKSTADPKAIRAWERRV